MSAVARRYARAVVDVAAEAGGDQAVEALAEGLRAFSSVFESSSELRELMLNPAFRNERAAVLGAVMKKAGVSEYVERLVRLLAESDRMDELGGVAQHVENLSDERAGRVRAYVRTATDLTEAQRERIAGVLHERLGRKVVVSVAIDTSLIGGLVCQVGDLTLDTSLKRQLEVLRERLEAGTH